MRPVLGKKPVHVKPFSGGGDSAIATCVVITILFAVSFLATYTSVTALMGKKDVAPLDENGSEVSVDQATGGAGAAESRKLAEGVASGATEAGAGAGDKDGAGGGEQLGQGQEQGGDLTGGGGDKPKFCRGIPNWELWGEPARWGTTNLVNSAEECCAQCRELCPEHEKTRCECNSWVYCGDEARCTDKYRQCWLKKQQDVLKPEVHAFASTPWTSGIIHPKGQGMIALETTHGSIRIKLHSTWAPYTVQYIREILNVRYCTGCQLYRAEGLGDAWDGEGNPLPQVAPGPPYALLQGSLQSDGVVFKEIPREASPPVRRGMACLIGGGPDFFISLAHHPEWGNAHTVFGEVVGDDDMEVVERIVALPTRSETWGEVQVAALEEPLSFMLKKHREANAE